MGKLVFAAIVFVVGYALYAAVRRQRQLLPTTLAEIVPRAILTVAIGIPRHHALFHLPHHPGRPGRRERCSSARSRRCRCVRASTSSGTRSTTS